MGYLPTSFSRAVLEALAAGVSVAEPFVHDLLQVCYNWASDDTLTFTSLSTNCAVHALSRRPQSEEKVKDLLGALGVFVWSDGRARRVESESSEK